MTLFAFQTRMPGEINWLAACRSPENPKKLMVKRLLALEGDWVAVPGEVDIHKIPSVLFHLYSRTMETKRRCSI